MKDFMKYTLASMLGLFLFSIVATILTIISLAGMVASENLGAPIEKNSVMRINLRGELAEQYEENPFDKLMGESGEAQGLDVLLEAIRKAKTNKNVKGIYLHGGAIAATPAMLQELRQALVDFKESGKFIYAYADTYTQGGYYISSVADTVLVNPQGGIDWHGMSSQPMFYKDVLAKVGVKMQVFKVGTYKSAVEPFICTEMSEANREQVTAFLTDIWQQMLVDVSASRHITQADLNAYADSFTLFRPTDQLLEWKLADKTAYIDEVRTLLREKMELTEDDKLNFVSPATVAKAEDPDKIDGKDKVAVYYAYGDIVVSSSPASGLTGDEHCIASEQVVQDLRNLREDKNVKAVVLRVNSGGGSAYASEQIWREVELLKQEKPVVVSMGGMAASGGYYISCGANKIFAEPTTLTGSIGIFGMIPDASELLTQKIGLKFDVVKTNAMSDFGTMSRGLNAQESAIIQKEIERGYETFTGRVAMGRKMTIDDVKAIAEGRVWTGKQALDRKLVDKLGNLQDAIAEAAKLANLEKYGTEKRPGPTPWFQSLMNDKKSDYLESQMRQALGEYYTTLSVLRTVGTWDRVQARMPFEMEIK